MSIPDLNPDYLPEGVFDCSFQELMNAFGMTTRRKELIEKLEKYTQMVKKAGISGWIIVNGSFVTSKEKPRDIDIILIRKRNFNLSSPVTDLENKILDEEYVKEKYELHLFPTIEGDQATLSMTSFFSRVKGKSSNIKKGLVRVAI